MTAPPEDLGGGVCFWVLSDINSNHRPPSMEDGGHLPWRPPPPFFCEPLGQLFYIGTRSGLDRFALEPVGQTFLHAIAMEGIVYAPSIILILALSGNPTDPELAHWVRWNGQTEPLGGVAEMVRRTTDFLKQNPPLPSDIRRQLLRCRSDAQFILNRRVGAMLDVTTALTASVDIEFAWRFSRLGSSLPIYVSRCII